MTPSITRFNDTLVRVLALPEANLITRSLAPDSALPGVERVRDTLCSDGLHEAVTGAPCAGDIS